LSRAGIGRTILAVAVIAMVVVAGFAVYEAYFAGGQSPCGVLQSSTPSRSHLTETTFGAVTEYKLPGGDRFPNAIAMASDGSVWFTEMEVPGVAHLFPGNGTLVEYTWPGYAPPTPPFCSPSVSTFGIAIWSGRVWAADQFDNAIVGISPSGGPLVSYNTTGVADYPYWLSVGPDGALWFTSDNTPARLGRIAPNMSMSAINLEGLGNDAPIQVAFVNSTLAYLSTVNLAENATTKSCICTGHIYSFDPSSVGSEVTPKVVGGGYTLVLPTSVSYLDGKVWVAQHYASTVASYDYATGTWTSYPTSLVPWSAVTLPYVIYATDGQVWFNEHYANKIALLNPLAGTLTEYSETDPPISNYSQIQNDESIALGDGGLWFTSISGNYVGFVSSDYNVGFNVTASGMNSARVAPGGSASFALKVTGEWTRPLGVNSSDSENLQSVPTMISIVPSATQIQPGVSSFDLGVKLAVSPSIESGNYTVAITVTDGDVQQVAYLFIDVT
jgi:streptogramin lyase